jgi:hypothetical protein
MCSTRLSRFPPVGAARQVAFSTVVQRAGGTGLMGGGTARAGRLVPYRGGASPLHTTLAKEPATSGHASCKSFRITIM